MASVYQAHQSNLDRLVAVKILSQALTNEPGYAERFNREAKTAASLEHPNIVPVYDYGTHEQITYVVMRLLTGGTVGERLHHQQQNGLELPSLSEVSQLLRQVASALDYAHSLGVIHRDIKPSNIMFDNRGTPYVVDFGIAKLLEGSANMTSTGMVMGTPAYMAPEQWRGDKISAATDQYAMGVLMYILLTGRQPFEAPTPYALMLKHMNDIPLSPSAIREDIPIGVAAVIERSISKQAEDRYPNMLEFADDLSRAVRDAGESKTGFFTVNMGKGGEAVSLTPSRQTKAPTNPPAQHTPTGTGAGTMDDDARTEVVLPRTGANVAEPQPEPSVKSTKGTTVKTIPPYTGSGGSGSQNVYDTSGQPPAAGKRPGIAVFGVVGAVVVIALIAFFISRGGGDGTPTPTATSAAVVVSASDTPSDEATTVGATNTSEAVVVSASDTPAVIAQVATDAAGKGQLTYEAIVDTPAVIAQVATDTVEPTATDVPPTATDTATDAPTTTPTNTATDAPTSTPTATNTDLPTLTPTPATPVALMRRQLTVRQGPGSQYPALTTLAAGIEVEILGISDDGAWFQILLDDGTLGWLPTSSPLITTAGNIFDLPEADPPTVTPTNTPEPSDTPTSTNTPTATTVFTATPTNTATTTPTLTPTPTATRPSATATRTRTPQPSATPVVNATVTGNQSINVRTGDGSSFSVLTSLRPGTVVKVLGISRTHNDWFQIELEDGRKGWVSARLVTISGNLASIPFVTPPQAPAATRQPTAVPTRAGGNNNNNGGATPVGTGVDCSQLRTTSPVDWINTNAEGGTTTFYWNTVPGANDYWLFWYAEDGHEVARYNTGGVTSSVQLDTRPTTKFGEFANYFWRIEAHKDGHVVCEYNHPNKLHREGY